MRPQETVFFDLSLIETGDETMIMSERDKMREFSKNKMN